ncbi:hypothetical protein LguiB_012450 [Lonicera macranthoides]
MEGEGRHRVALNPTLRDMYIEILSTSKLAKKCGDKNLAQCGIIASDEKRHEVAYTKVVAKLFEIDPNDTIIAFSNIMKKKISMPSHFMYNG